MSDNPKTQDYPRHVHKADGLYLRVNNVDEYLAALEDGWLPTPPLTPEQAAERYAFQVAAGEIVEPKPVRLKVPKPPPAVAKAWGRKL